MDEMNNITKQINDNVIGELYNRYTIILNEHLPEKTLCVSSDIFNTFKKDKKFEENITKMKRIIEEMDDDKNV